MSGEHQTYEKLAQGARLSAFTRICEKWSRDLSRIRKIFPAAKLGKDADDKPIRLD
jgi:hypothetical protein